MPPDRRTDPAGATAPEDLSLLDARLVPRLERLSLASRRRVAESGSGDRRSSRRGSSLEFMDYRHYVDGDDPNRVDWSVYARTDVLFIRTYEEEEALNVQLILDLSASMDWGEPNKLVFARRLGAALGYVALSSASRLTLWAARSGPITQAFGPTWGRGRRGDLLSSLERMQAAPASTLNSTGAAATASATDLHNALSGFFVKGGGLVVLVSDLLSPTWDRAIQRLAACHQDTVVLHTLCPAELRPELGGDVRLIDREGGGAVSVTINGDALALYRQRLATWQAAITGLCARQGVTYVPLDTSSSLERVVFDQLRRRRVIQ